MTDVVQISEVDGVTSGANLTEIHRFEFA